MKLFFIKIQTTTKNYANSADFTPLYCTHSVLLRARFLLLFQNSEETERPTAHSAAVKACSYLILAHMGRYMRAEWAEKFVVIFWSKVQSFKSAKSTLFLQSSTDYLCISIINYQNCLKRSFF